MYNYKKANLNNGLECSFYSNKNLHSISIGLYFKAGLLYEEGLYGISHLIEHLFFRRLHDLEQKELYYLMESIGGSLRGGTFLDSMCFNLKVLPLHFTTAIGIIHRIFLHEQWTNEDIKKEKQVVLNQIEYQYYEGFYEYANRIYFSGTNFEYPIMGRKSYIKSITAKEIELFMNKIINPKTACLVMTGNITSIDQKGVIELFNNIKVSDNSVRAKEITPHNYCQRSDADNFIDDIEWQTSEVLISFDVPSYLDIYCVNFISSILGEGVGSKLPMLLREKLGLTNEIYSEVKKHPGVKRLVIKLMVNNVNLEDALIAVFKVLKEIKIQISKCEYNSSRVFLTENKRFLYDDSDKLNFVIGYDSFIQGEKFIDIENMINDYSIISIKDLQSTAEKLLTGKNLFIVVSNNKNIVKHSKIKKALSDLRKSIST